MSSEMLILVLSVTSFVVFLVMAIKLRGTRAASFHRKLAPMINGEISNAKVEFNQGSFRVKVQQIAIGTSGESQDNRDALQVTYDIPTPCVLTIRDQASVIGQIEKILGAESIEIGVPAVDDAYLLHGSSQLWAKNVFAQPQAAETFARLFRDSSLFEISFSDEGLQIIRNIIGSAAEGPCGDEPAFFKSLEPLAKLAASMDTSVIPTDDYSTKSAQLKSDGFPALPTGSFLLGALSFFPLILYAQSLGIDINRAADTRDHLFSLALIIGGCVLYAALSRARLAKLGIGMYVSTMVLVAAGMLFWSFGLNPYIFHFLG